MKTNKLLFSVFLSTTIYLLLTTGALADYGQYGQYSSEPAPSASILIDKTVGKPDGTVTKGGVTNIQYVDNLSPSDVRFRPGEQVMFKLRVKNTSNVTLNNVMVNDIVPSYVEPIEGPGMFDAVTRLISFNAGSFAPDEEKTFTIKMQLYGQDKLPTDKGLFCLINKSRAYNELASDEDTAQFCVEKEVIGVVSTPKAGPEMGTLLLGAQAMLVGLGFSLKKITKRT